MPQAEKFFTFPIDHVIAIKHGGETSQDNLCLSCPDCNVYKGSDISSLDPVSGQISRLFNPRRDTWIVHFELQGAHIVPLTIIGRTTETLLRLNHPQRVLERMELIAVGRYPSASTSPDIDPR